MSVLNTIQTGRESRPPRILIYGQEGVGKAQPLDANVLTPAGFVPMGTIAVGDRVIGSDGKSHTVLGVFNRGTRDVYRVVFRDGSQTECCDEHLWFTQTRGERDRGYPGSVRMLSTIRRSLRYGTHHNHAVPRVAPVEFAHGTEPLPIHPWLLGIYLAEGCAGNMIFNSEADIQAHILACLDAQDRGAVSDRSIRIAKSDCRASGPAAFREALRRLGLEDKKSDTKFIPREYLHASAEERLNLLRGLIDGDGYVAKPGAVELCTASDRMAEDIMFLVRSLGGAAVRIKRNTHYSKDGIRFEAKPSNRLNITFTNGIVPVSSEKHLKRWKSPEWIIRHTIRKVEYTGKKECRCIVIDAPDALYVTDDFILTHNSSFCANAPNPVFIQTEDGLGEIDTAKFPLSTSLAAVADALTALRDEEHDFQTVVLDSADWLERLIFDEVCREFGVRSIEKADGGYGKGYVHALTHWRKTVHLLQELRDRRNMIVIIIAHSKIERFEDPENAAYDRYAPRLHKAAVSLLSEWADAVLFATRKFRVTREQTGFTGERGIAAPVGADGGERVLRTAGGPACLAKNRFNLPFEIPLSWDAFMDAYRNGHGGAACRNE